jgi:beta-glucosidase
VIDRALVRVFTLRMKTGEFDPRAGQPYTKIKASTIQSKAHRALTEKVAKRSLVLLKNGTPAGRSGPLLPAAPKKLRRVVILGDQADKVFLGGYSGAPAERVSLRQGLTEAITAANPGASITYDAAGSSSTSSQPVRLSAATQRAVRDADLVVVMVGTDASTNAEGADRKNVAMPGNYASLVEQAAAVGNPRLALVVQAAGMVELGAVKDKVASVLFSGPNGQRQGRAFAGALLGAVNPSGRLNFTWYRDGSQLPPMDDYDLAPRRTGGLGRTYQYFTGTPDYRFGFGLSYTTFRWSKIRVDRSKADANDTARVTLTVRNAGSRAGADIVQVYAKTPKVSGREVPIRRLVGFRKTRELAPGASQTIAIDVPIADALRLWHASAKRSTVYPGTWTFEVSRSAGDAVGRLPVRISGRIDRSIRHLTAQAPKSTLKVGDTLNLRGNNRWLQGVAPTGTNPRSQDIVTAVRDDDSFADLGKARLRYRSSDPRIVEVTRDGRLIARRRGVATISVSIAGKTARIAFAVR